MTPIVIPPPREQVVRRNPQVLVLIGAAQIGKTTAVAALPDTLILELQLGGADYVPHCWSMTERDFGDVTKPDGRAKFLELLDYLGAQRLAGKPVAKRLCIDHLGIIDELIYDIALDKFLRTPRGISYTKANPNDPLLQITDLPGPAGSPGWGYYREELGMLHRRILMAAPELIYIGHPRATKITKVYGDVMIEDVDLSGTKARRLFCGEASALAFCRRENVKGEDRFVVSFKTSELSLQASRCPHLSGKEFVVGISKVGQLPSFRWNEIYLDDFPDSATAVSAAVVATGPAPTTPGAG